MYKKLVIFVFILLLSSFQVNASYDINWEIWQWVTPTTTSLAEDYLNWNSVWVTPTISKSNISDKKLNSLQNDMSKKAKNKNYLSKDNFAGPAFTIKVDDIIPGGHIEWKNAKEVTNKLLGTIIQSLMIPLWAIALLIMTIWAWYMIFYHWQDELLSKWQSIFNSWLIALIIALSAYYMVSLVRFILYSTQ